MKNLGGRVGDEVQQCVAAVPMVTLLHRNRRKRMVVVDRQTPDA